VAGTPLLVPGFVFREVWLPAQPRTIQAALAQPTASISNPLRGFSGARR